MWEAVHFGHRNIILFQVVQIHRQQEQVMAVVVKDLAVQLGMVALLD
jgi:hypothetical protein